MMMFRAGNILFDLDKISNVIKEDIDDEKSKLTINVDKKGVIASGPKRSIEDLYETIIEYYNRNKCFITRDDIWKRRPETNDWMM